MAPLFACQHAASKCSITLSAPLNTFNSYFGEIKPKLSVWFETQPALSSSATPRRGVRTNSSFSFPQRRIPRFVTPLDIPYRRTRYILALGCSYQQPFTAFSSQPEILSGQVLGTWDTVVCLTPLPAHACRLCFSLYHLPTHPATHPTHPFPPKRKSLQLNLLKMSHTHSLNLTWSKGHGRRSAVDALERNRAGTIGAALFFLIVTSICFGTVEQQTQTASLID